MLIDLPSFTRLHRSKLEMVFDYFRLARLSTFLVAPRRYESARYNIITHARVNAYYRTCNVIYLAINLSVLIYYAKKLFSR